MKEQIVIESEKLLQGDIETKEDEGKIETREE